MMTLNDLIQLALRDAGVVGMEQPIPASYINDAFLRLRLMLQAWTDEGMLIPCLIRNSFPLLPGKNTYSVGPGADADVKAPRPETIASAFLRRGELDYPLWVASFDNYNAIREKFAGGMLRALAYQPTSPNGTIYLWPTPDGSDTLFYSAEVPFTDPVDQFEEVQLPASYQPAIHLALTVAIAAGYGLPLDQNVTALAIKAKDSLVKRNLAARKFAGRPEYELVAPNIVYDIYGG